MSGTVPQSGDAVIIESGTPELIDATIVAEQITLGSVNSGSAVTLLANSAVFEPLVIAGKAQANQTITVTGGSFPVSATFLSYGFTTYEGQIFVEAFGGSLTIDAESFGAFPGEFQFLNTIGSTFVLVTQESALHFTGEKITTAGVIEVEGSLDIAASVSFGGDGVVALENGGHLSIEGSIRLGQQIDFADGTGTVTIANLDGFQGIFGFTTVGGDRIDLKGVQAQSEAVVDGLLTLYSGANQTGAIVAQVNVQTISQESLNPTYQSLGTADFRIAPDGTGGTFVTYAPQGVTHVEGSLPVPVVAPTGTLVSLSAILEQSFGTTAPTPYGMTLVSPKILFNTATDHKYWSDPGVAPAWYVNGVQIKGNYVVQPGDSIQLLVGNNIAEPAQLMMQVTAAGTGTDAEFITYDVWTVDPAVAQFVSNLGATPGSPTPHDMIAAALSYNAIFPDVPNTNLCNSIADDVAAAAGAPMPLPDALRAMPESG